jgi:hypothetical protein
MTTHRYMGLVASLLLVGLPYPICGQAAVSGTIYLKEGPQPLPGVLELSDECLAKNDGRPVRDRTLVVNEDGTLRHVFVYISQGLEEPTFEIPDTAATLTEHGCMFNPHVLGMMAGQRIKLVNSDRLLDNVHSFPQINEPVNTTVLAFQREALISHGFTQSEVMIPLKCDVHAWQIAYVGVLSHPYFAVTGEEGTFELADPGPGSYTLTAWHEKLGTQSRAFDLTAGGATRMDFTFSLESSRPSPPGSSP